MRVVSRSRCRNRSPISVSEAPLWSSWVASEWRSRCAPLRAGLLGRGAYGGQFVNQRLWEHGCTWIDALPKLYRRHHHWRVLQDDIHILVWMICRDCLNVGPDNSQMLCEIDPKRFVGPEGIPMSFKNSCRQEEVRYGIRMTADFAIAPIAVLQKSINALFGEVHGHEGMSLEPAAEVGE
jgi:hypothetical protein